MSTTTILRSGESPSVAADWGKLTWWASSELGNSADMTVGRCVIKPGESNPRHSHPNCYEVLVVERGRIAHLIEDGKEVEMEPGDVISVPRDLPHQARNIGNEDAVLFIVFSSGDRETRGE